MPNNGNNFRHALAEYIRGWGEGLAVEEEKYIGWRFIGTPRKLDIVIMNPQNCRSMAIEAKLQETKALGMSSGGGGSSSQQNSAALLARVISAEARGEPYSGQVAVGAVILNRVEHPSFPNTIAGVVYQPGAFTCMVDGQFNEPVADSAYRAAQDALNGADPSGGAIYYFNPDTATSAWIWSRPLIKTIGKHRFCA